MTTDSSLMGTDVVRAVPDGRGTTTVLSRTARAERTEELLRRAANAADPQERRAVLDEVVVLNLRIADAVAGRYRGRGVPQEDLQQAAYEGLVKAVHRYDAAQADDLLTFAVPTIRGEVQRHFRDRAWVIRPTRRVQEMQPRVNATLARLSDELGREPLAAEMCQELGITYADYAEVVNAFGCFSPPSLDQPVGDGPGATALGDLLADERADHDAAEARCVLGPALRGLGERDRRLLFLRYFEDLTQREIGYELGVTQAQVSSMLKRVMRRLRTSMEQEHHDHAGCEARTA